MTPTSTPTRTPQRQPLPDAIRALALIAVLVMNGIGYAFAPWGPQLGFATPPDSALAPALQGIAAALLQGKGYSILAFVFGMALWLSTRGAAGAQARARVRNGRLLGLGIVHGVFVYFGDILTLYALVSRGLLGRLRLPWARMKRRLAWALVFAAASKILLAWIVLHSPPQVPDALPPGMGQVQGALDFLRLNATTYAWAQVAAVFVAAPAVYLCMLAGVAAARLRLLTHRRWRPRLARGLRWGVAALALPVLGYGWACAALETTHAWRPWADAMGEWLVLPQAALYLAAFGLASRGGDAPWCRHLAPLGQRTLTLYIGHSVLCVVLWSGLGLALAMTTAQTVGVCLALWCLAWAAARASGCPRWPLEAWLGRR